MRYPQDSHRLFLRIAAILAVTVTLGTAPIVAADWTQFRGPDRNGISPETDLATSWPEAGPAELWRQPIGDSFSGVVAIEGALFTTTSDDQGDHALRLDPATGKTVWRTRLASTFTDSFGNGPRITPTLDGDRLFVLAGGGHLTALGREKGDVLWTVDLRETFGAELPHWGFASAPLVLDELLILDVGAPDAAIVAFDKTDGEVRWKAGSGGNAYSSPAIHTIAGQRQLVLLRSSGLVGLSLDGDELWSHEWAPRGNIKPALPIFLAPDLLVASASYGIGALAIRVRADETGAFTTEEVWQSNVLRTHFNSSVLIDGKIYGFDNATLKCIDPTTGEVLWAQRRGLGKGSLIAADGRLIVLTENGTLKLVEATPETYRELASHPVLSGRSWTEPTLADGRVYLRNREEIVALDLRDAGTTTATAAASTSPATSPTVVAETTGATHGLAEIRRRHDRAVGDLATIREGQGLRIRGTYDAEGNLWPFTLTISHAGAYRLEVDMDRGQGLEVSNGTTAWIDDPGDEPAELLPADQASWANADLATFATPWLATVDDGVELELVGTADLDGRPAYHLRAHVAEDRTEEWYIDPDDFLVRRKDVQANIEWLGDYTRVYWYHRYGEHQGVRLPHFTERVDETFVKLFHVESVDTLEQIDPAIFEAPANARAPEAPAADAR